jgi:ankyrin repeat protein
MKDTFVCPLSRELMLDPVILHTGRSFDRISIEKWLATNVTDPVTGEPLPTTMVFPNIHLRKSIDEYIVQNVNKLFIEALSSVHYSVRLVQRCIELGANVNTPIKVGDEYCPPIHAIAYKGDNATLTAMLNSGADVNVKLTNGVTAFFTACTEGQLSTAAILLKFGANVNEKDVIGYTSLFYAVIDSNIKVMEFLLDNGAEIHEKDSKGNSLVHVAIKSDAKAALELLLARDSSIVDLTDDNGTTALHRAAQKGSVLAATLINYNTNVNAKANNGWTPLHYAAKNDRKALVTLLLEKGANIEVVNDSGKTPLQVASPECKQLIKQFREDDVQRNPHVYIKKLEAKLIQYAIRDKERDLEIRGFAERLKYLSERLDAVMKEKNM